MAVSNSITQRDGLQHTPTLQSNVDNTAQDKHINDKLASKPDLPVQEPTSTLVNVARIFQLKQPITNSSLVSAVNSFSSSLPFTAPFAPISKIGAQFAICTLAGADMHLSKSIGSPQLHTPKKKIGRTPPQHLQAILKEPILENAPKLLQELRNLTANSLSPNIATTAIMALCTDIIFPPIEASQHKKNLTYSIAKSCKQPLYASEMNNVLKYDAISTPNSKYIDSASITKIDTRLAEGTNANKIELYGGKTLTLMAPPSTDIEVSVLKNGGYHAFYSMINIDGSAAEPERGKQICKYKDVFSDTDDMNRRLHVLNLYPREPKVIGIITKPNRTVEEKHIRVSAEKSNKRIYSRIRKMADDIINNRKIAVNCQKGRDRSTSMAICATIVALCKELSPYIERYGTTTARNILATEVLRIIARFKKDRGPTVLENVPQYFDFILHTAQKEIDTYFPEETKK